jgi:hypothetical protein
MAAAGVGPVENATGEHLPQFRRFETFNKQQRI